MLKSIRILGAEADRLSRIRGGLATGIIVATVAQATIIALEVCFGEWLE